MSKRYHNAAAGILLVSLALAFSNRDVIIFKEYAESFKCFIDEIANFKNSMGINDEVLGKLLPLLFVIETFIDKGFSHFTSGLKEIASFQEFLVLLSSFSLPVAHYSHSREIKWRDL